MKPTRIEIVKRPAPFAESVPILSKHLDEKRLLESLKGPNPLTDPYVQKYRAALVEGLTKYFQFGCYDEDGIFNYRPRSIQEQLSEIVLASKLMTAGSGFITPDKTPDFYQLVDVFRDLPEQVPDTSYLDFMVATKMTQEIESRREWDATFEFVLMKEAGQIKFGSFATRAAQITNDEWGSGMELSWTWMETNQFGVKLSRLAPKFKFASFDQKAKAVYALVVSTFTTAITSGTNIVIKDINIAMNELMRYTDDFNRTPFKNSRFRILAPPESWWFLDQAMRTAGSAPQYPGFLMGKRPTITYTTELNTAGSAPYTIFVVADKYEQNEFPTRIPLEAHGPQEDITKFATLVSYREAYGAALNAASARIITFDPTDVDTFSIGSIPLVYTESV